MARETPNLRLEHCAVRPWADGDRAALVRHANEREIWRNLRDRFPHPYTPEAAEQWLAYLAQTDPLTHFAIDVDGEAAGGIGFEIGEDVHRRSAEIGYWLGRAVWGRGIGTEALRAVTAWAFAQHDLCRVEAHVFGWNAASMRVLEKVGYSCEARHRQAVTKDGATVDMVIFAMLRS
jgi:ribosomal-protein-alanine N-acetyltransferase